MLEVTDTPNPNHRFTAQLVTHFITQSTAVVENKADGIGLFPRVLWKEFTLGLRRYVSMFTKTKLSGRQFRFVPNKGKWPIPVSVNQYTTFKEVVFRVSGNWRGRGHIWRVKSHFCGKTAPICGGYHAIPKEPLKFRKIQYRIIISFTIK